MFEGLRARLEQFLAQRSGPADQRAYAAQLYSAVVEAKAAVAAMRDALAASERELMQEQKQLADAERRGRLAAEISDRETEEVAERFARRHRERVALLERRLLVQRDELGMAQREVEEMTAQLRSSGLTGGAAAEQAWQELERAGGARPGTDVRSELLQHELDRAAREAAAEAQLEHLKRKLGKEQNSRADGRAGGGAE